MFCICNEKHIFNKLNYYLPEKYSTENYERYSVDDFKIIKEIIEELIEILEVKNQHIEIKEDYFDYEEKELNEDYVSTGYFTFNSFLRLGNYINVYN